MTSDAAERAARSSYGRLLAMLAVRSRDIAASEDALADAFVAALERWPRDGVPDNPDAWLLTAARRRLLDGQRRLAVRERHVDTIVDTIVDRFVVATNEDIPAVDDRLRLLFVCAHPAIDPSTRVPLMLQTVLGLDAARIGSAMCVAPKTMGQRLWRAKTKIRDAAIPFELPAATELPGRLDAVLEAIYAAFGAGWDDLAGGDADVGGLADEAIFLARLLTALLPAEAEPRGLLALMLFAEARRAARRTADGRFVPLDQQDAQRWSAALIREAEHMLASAAALGHIGAYQIEAAIQSAHVEGARTGRRDHAAIATLYEGLVRLAPTLGACIGRAAALLPHAGAPTALAALDELAGPRTDEHQPYWAARAHVLAALGRGDEARAAYARAIGLTQDPAVRAFLAARRGEVDQGSAASAAASSGPGGSAA